MRPSSMTSIAGLRSPEAASKLQACRLVEQDGHSPLTKSRILSHKSTLLIFTRQDEAKTNFGYPRPQYMTQAYVGLHLSRRGPTRPDGDRGGRRGRRLRLGRGSRERSERREDQQGRIGSNLCSKGSGRRNAKLEPKMPGKFRKGSKVPLKTAQICPNECLSCIGHWIFSPTLQQLFTRSGLWTPLLHGCSSQRGMRFEMRRPSK